jgi:DNA-binding Xre family transcriptional regulator
VDKEMSAADLRRATGISQNTMAKIKNKENVSLDILLKICVCLDCDIGDICSFVKIENTAD